MASPKKLHITNARENNLKSLSLDVKHDALTVVTGLSGSGKSSLAFDTVYAEGQRRYIETFSPYTRQFFDKVKKPDLDAIENVRPAIAIQQRTRITGSRSTVGSLTNINDYLKIIWSNFSTPVCPVCDIQLKSYTASELATWLITRHQLTPWNTYLICASLEIKLPKAPAKKKATQLVKLVSELPALGFTRIFNPKTGSIDQIEAQPEPALTADNRLMIVLDRLKAEATSINKKRIQDSIDQAYSLDGQKLPSGAFPHTTCLIIQIKEFGGRGVRDCFEPSPRLRHTSGSKEPRKDNCDIWEFSPQYRCEQNRFKLTKPRPALFSFNHPLGACPDCKGFGRILAIDPQLIIPNPTLSLKEKAIQCWAGAGSKIEYRELIQFCKEQDISVDTAWKDLPQAHKDLIFTHKSKTFWGVNAWFRWLERKTYKMHVRVLLSRYRNQALCPTCHGFRLKPDSLAYRIKGKTIADIWNTPVNALIPWLQSLETTKTTKAVGEVLHACISRLQFLEDLGLSYLTLDRQARTLSGGETQRVNLASALGSELISTQFVLDEPSVGLHPRDTNRLIKSIQNLTRLGNSTLMVEHDLDCINSADEIIELGPGAGEKGGTVVYNGPAQNWKGITVDRTLQQFTPSARSKFLKIKNAGVRNLKNISVHVPLGAFTCLTGVSGSGKSTLVNEVIFKAYQHAKIGLEPESDKNLVTGFEQLEELQLVNQAPLSKSPRANIATYSGMWDRIRVLLSQTDDAQMRALGKSAFSFNVDAGRCPECKGSGFIREDMQFLSDVYVPCELCLGKRFQPTILEVKYKGKDVATLLGTTVDAALQIFQNEKDIIETCEILSELGLGHLTLGHPLSELSGGEAQRLKLVPFLSHTSIGKSLLIFDEPTTGLHLYDVERLIRLFRSLSQKGHSILCIEHNLRLIAASDWIIDLGPEGGDKGGFVIAEGCPYELSKNPGNSYTAQYLNEYARGFHDSKASTNGSAPQKKQADLKSLQIRGAREHNLKNIDLDIPLDTFIALTGVSGSGKSTIAKDIVYAEGQRRYLDCLSPYARQFIKELKRPDIDEIKNIKPTICVYQHTFSPSQLSTVATMSEVYNFLRLLYAKSATQYCPDHPDSSIAAQSPEEIAKEIKRIGSKTVRLLAPVIKMKKGHHRQVLERAVSSEVTQIRVDGVFLSPGTLNLSGGLEKSKIHSIDFVVGKFNPANVDDQIVADGVSQALSLGGGTMIVLSDSGESVFSSERTCPVCKKGFFRPDPEDLSYHSKRGVCSTCQGTGKDDQGNACEECSGSRINAIGRNLRIEGKSIADLCKLSAPELLNTLQKLTLTERQLEFFRPLQRELFSRIQALISIGLDYIALDRDCTTLSGGELQRLRLSTAIGTRLSGVLYIFDEPSVGLHPLDNRKVLPLLRELKGEGNSVIMIEHDAESICSSDYVIDVGPGGGSRGGNIEFQGPIEEFTKSTISPTSLAIQRSAQKTPPSKAPAKFARMKVESGACNNIKNIKLSVPLHALVTFAGVSGAGKSTLVHQIISNTLEEGTEKKGTFEFENKKITPDEPITRVLEVNQKPIGINSRSTPASYLKVWDDIRKLFASTTEAKTRGWKEGFFSYNSGKGRCLECKGLGVIRLEMSFLPDAQVLCETCSGTRFSDDALSIRYLGLSPKDVLALTFEEAKQIFAQHKRVYQSLHLACELGLEYLTLGQSSTTLSGGESQRIKLVSELASRPKGHTLYILDEPTTGLHKNDVSRLMKMLKELVVRGNSVFIIEHDADVLRTSDYIIELGPGPAERGGKVIFEGRPEALTSVDTPWGKLFRDVDGGARSPESVESQQVSAV